MNKPKLPPLFIVILLIVIVASTSSYAQENSRPAARGTDRDSIAQEASRVYWGLTLKDWHLVATALGSLGTLFVVLVGLRLAQKRLDTADRIAKTASTQADTARTTSEAALKQANAALKQAETAHRGQLTERFTEAVRMLSTPGPDSLTVRLGGIHALAAIAQESREDHWPVMEVLCAFVRVKTVCRQAKQQYIVGACQADVDIQAILDVLRDRKLAHEIGPRYLNLRGAKLAGADLRYAKLDGADLRGVDLREVDMEFAKLNKVNLRSASLTRAQLAHSELVSAVLKDADFSHADLEGADLDGAKLWGVNIRDASLRFVNLRNADFFGGASDFEAESFEKANLDNVKNTSDEFIKWAVHHGGEVFEIDDWRDMPERIDSETNYLVGFE